MAKILIYHPLVDSTGDLLVPVIGDLVWFSHDNLPVMGKVLAVDTTLPRTIMVQLLTPTKGSTRVVDAVFTPTVDDQNQPVVMQLTVQQVVMTVSDLTPGGRLRAADKRRLNEFLRS